MKELMGHLHNLLTRSFQPNYLNRSTRFWWGITTTEPKIKGTVIEYIGSSRQHNFGEDEDKGYTLLYSDGSYEFIKNHVNIR